MTTFMIMTTATTTIIPATIMLDDFLVRAVIAGLGAALAAGPLGCFVVWRRMAYFGEATAHAAILGVALSLAFEFNLFAGMLSVSAVMAVLVTILSGRGMAVDTALGVLAHAALAFGLVGVALIGARINLDAYLFGDLLAVSRSDLGVIWGSALIVVAVLTLRWSRLLTATLNAELAHASGIDTRREQLILSVILALVVALSIKVVGALLIVALLIIPAAAARSIARTPEAMAVMATAIAVLAMLSGLGASATWDLPAGPAIVAAAAVIFTATAAFARRG